MYISLFEIIAFDLEHANCTLLILAAVFPLVQKVVYSFTAHLCKCVHAKPLNMYFLHMNSYQFNLQCAYTNLQDHEKYDTNGTYVNSSVCSY